MVIARKDGDRIVVGSTVADSLIDMTERDLSLLELIPKLIDAGVTSFKIEGRMKHSGYVAICTNLYKNAFCAVLSFVFHALRDEKVDETVGRAFGEAVFVDNECMSFCNEDINEILSFCRLSNSRVGRGACFVDSVILGGDGICRIAEFEVNHSIQCRRLLNRYTGKYEID